VYTAFFLYSNKFYLSKRKFLVSLVCLICFKNIAELIHFFHVTRLAIWKKTLSLSFQGFKVDTTRDDSSGKIL
jgi:hypothetical protein